MDETMKNHLKKLEEPLHDKIRRLEEQLEDTNKRLEILLENIPAGVISYEASTGKFRMISNNCLELFGCTEQDFRDRYYNSFDLFIMKEDRSRVKEMIVAQSEFLSTIEVTFRVKDLMNEIRFLDYRGKKVVERSGDELFWATLTDATERVLIQNEMQRVSEELYLESQRYKLLEEAVDDIPFDYDVQTDVMQVTRKGIHKGVVFVNNFNLENKLENFVHPDNLVEMNALWNSCLFEQKKGTQDCRLHFDTTEYGWYRIHYVSFQDKTERIVRIVGSMKDISKEHLEKENLKQIIRHDPLTGILNKATIQTAIAEYITSEEPDKTHALFVVDADNFKAINDNLGHMFGDTVIQFVANTIKKTFRDTDLVGRIGGDEFMILMKSTNLQGAEAKAVALNNAMRQTFEKDGISIGLSCSIGVAFSGINGTDYGTLFANADNALYEAKKMGRNQYQICK